MYTDALTTVLGDGIVQIRLPMTGNPLRHINGYLVPEADGFTLIDCGWKRTTSSRRFTPASPNTTPCSET